MRTHVVQKGDTLWKIAKQYGISFDELKRLNGHLANPDYVIPGMEILLPENGSNKAVTTRTTSYKEKLTEPFAPIEEQSAPASEVRSMKEEMTMPMPMPEKQTQTQPIEEVRPPKEQITQPIMPAPTPAPIPQIQPEVMPEFHFAPQFTFTQPMPQQMPIPQPIPQPMPQPIMIEVPKPEVKIEEKEVTKTEYVPVPQPYYVYVPYCPEPVKPPCPCKHQHHAPRPCGCGGMQHPMHMPVQQPMPIQHMDMPCGCNSVPYNHLMMPYDSNFMQPQYFEPNYDIAPVMEDNSKDSTLPDWLVDSSSVPEVMGVSQHGKGEMYDEFSDDKDYYHQMRGTEDGQFSPTEYYGQYDMNNPSMYQMPYQTMPENFMPYQTMPENFMPYQTMPENFMPYQTMPGNFMPNQTMPENFMPYQSMPEHQMSQHFGQHPHMMQQHLNYPTQPYYPNQYHSSSSLKPWSY